MRITKGFLIGIGILALTAILVLGVYYFSPMNPDSPANREERLMNPPLNESSTDDTTSSDSNQE